MVVVFISQKGTDDTYGCFSPIAAMSSILLFFWGVWLKKMARQGFPIGFGNIFPFASIYIHWLATVTVTLKDIGKVVCGNMSKICPSSKEVAWGKVPRFQ